MRTMMIGTHHLLLYSPLGSMAVQNRLMLFDVLSVQRQRDFPGPQANVVREGASDNTGGHHGETCRFSRVVFVCAGEGVAVAAADCASGRSCK